MCMIAAEALGPIGEATAVPYLLAILHNRNRAARNVVVEAIGKIGHRDTAPDILKTTKARRSEIDAYTA